jgi:hypothetical protein
VVNDGKILRFACRSFPRDRPGYKEVEGEEEEEEEGGGGGGGGGGGAGAAVEEEEPEIKVVAVGRQVTFSALMDELTEDYGFNLNLFYEVGVSEAEKGVFNKLESQNDLTDLFENRNGTILCDIRPDLEPRGLTELLAQATFGDEGTAIIAEALPTNRVLTKLDLSSNRATLATAARVAAALRENKSLRVLHLGFNAFGDEGSRIVCEALHAHASITTLDLAGNKLTRLGFRAVKELLRKNSLVTCVGQSLKNHPIDGAGTQTRLRVIFRPSFAWLRFRVKVLPKVGNQG